jgi:hypothetical protein
MDVLKRILEGAKDGWLIIGITALMFTALEGALRLGYFIYDRTSDAAATAADRRAEADVYQGSSWVREYYEEFEEANRMKWMPYLYWRRAPFQGDYINIDDDGIRWTWQPNGSHARQDDALKIFMFGGSALWGTGARDDLTIPSLLARVLHERGFDAEITNFGEAAYVSSQEIVGLLIKLREADVPDLVIFYDGVNDTYSAFQQAMPGLPQNEADRVYEFNLSKPHRFGELRSRVVLEVSDRLVTVRLVRSLLRRLGIGGPPDATAGDQPAVGKPPSSDYDLINGVIAVYKNNMQLVAVLGDYFDFRCLFYWQPTIFQKKVLTEYEESEWQRQDALQAFFQKVYDRLPQSGDIPIGKGHSSFHDLSMTFYENEGPVFVDWCHLGESGNAIIAETIAADVIAALDDSPVRAD